MSFGKLSMRLVLELKTLSSSRWPSFYFVNFIVKLLQRIMILKTNLVCIIASGSTQDPQNASRNRGFAFVLYYNNACADYSRQKMSSSNFKLDGNTPTVTWADPKSTSDHSAAAQVNSN